MAKQKKRRVKHKSERTGMDKDAETTAIDKWLRMLDKPLEKKEGDKRGRHKRRGKQ